MIGKSESGKLFLLGVVIMLILACNIIGSNPQGVTGRAARRTPLPTLTPTFIAVSDILPRATDITESAVVPAGDVAATATILATLPAPVVSEPQVPSGSGPATATPGNFSDSEPILAPVAIPGWAFANLHSRPDPYGDGVLVNGDIINNTGSTQELIRITGTFFDAQGQIAAGADNMVDYWPFDVVPVGGQLPFELTVFDLQQAADFDLMVESQPSNQAPHQNFNVANVEQWSEDDLYCLAGQLENHGDFINEYVVILAVLIDSQDQMLAFGDYFEPEPAEGLTGSPLEFDICMDVGDQNVARYQLRAWGQ